MENHNNSENYEDIESNVDSGRILASIQLVEAMNKHPNADTLQLATILGWQLIVRNDEVQIGQKVIFCEIDSLLPVDAPWLPQAVKDRIVKEQLTTKFRVKTIKLRGEISQGLIIPLWDDMQHMDIGTDVTALLKITKYEPPALTGKFALYQSKRIGNFPVHLLKKTDEHRIQSRPRYLSTMADQPYYISLKMDGTSVTYLIDPVTNDFVVCSRNMKRGRPDNFITCPYWYIVHKYDLEAKLRLHPDYALQGEICGPNIQKNLAGFQDLHLFVFNVVNIRTKQVCDFEQFITFCKTIDVPTVPIEERGMRFVYTTVKELLEKARGCYKGTKNAREGLVIRTLDMTTSFKVINNDYL